MSDATIAMIAGSVLVMIQLVVVRVMDWYFPRGRMSKRVAEQSVEQPVEHTPEQEDPNPGS